VDWVSPTGLKNISEEELWRKADEFERMVGRGKKGIERIVEETRHISPTFRMVRDNKDISPKVTEKLYKAIKTYDVDDVELQDYLTLSAKGRKITDADVKDAIEKIKLVNEIRPSDGYMILPYLSPVKRVLGERFIAPFRHAELKILEEQTPYLKKVKDVFRGIDDAGRQRISDFREGLIDESRLTEAEKKANKALQDIYDELWDKFGIKEYVERYSPRRVREMSDEELKRWAFSKKGMREFKFWARHKRRGELIERERDARRLVEDYIRAGFREKYHNKAIEEVKSIFNAFDPDRKEFAQKWIDTVIHRMPTKDEVIAERAVRRMLKMIGKRPEDDARLYRSLVSTLLDLNYSSFMGARPKLAIRNLTQQWLIANEYGYTAYTKGRLWRAGKYADEIRDAMKASDVVQLRKKQYAVFEDKIRTAADIPQKLREKMLWMYRVADIDNIETAFATGYIKAREAGLSAERALKAGEKAIHNTQWGYGMDLPYYLKTPTGKVVGQYTSWPVWYMDHIFRIVKERHGAKALRTLVQGMVIMYLLKRFGIDYTRTFLFGTVPETWGYTAESIKNLWNLGKALIRARSSDITRYGAEVAKIPFGYTPGYLAYRDLIKGVDNPIEALLYTRKEKISAQRSRPGRRRD